ncbi:pyrimidine 5'-nucleotidase [Shewanella sp. NIFS-20-20]|uniref:pyrimidine 5'-nucleotidase n=1 Tax=Shewanella sp. NIFS-20-20 TaxID=2853806 RepID=UPI001C4586EE|nr:pyrimidine 5'-nucleotidase [Shewanella sp. NIFS-20-20]MBV7315405.1 pyrimidine 5'-nucleotidase [Shewanella sp. NIFS-20-20]
MNLDAYQFDWILFDADETLFHFDAFAGLKLLFSRHGVAFSEQDFEEYQLINKPLWLEYQEGTIDAQHLQLTRFAAWAKRLGCSASELNQGFLAAMADICQPLPGVTELLEVIRGHYRLGIITNGFTQLQQVRLQKTGLSEYFSLVVISEEVRVAKPAPAIFEHSLMLMSDVSRSQIAPHKVLMVGDNLHTDIVGGNRMGLATCWYNPQGHPRDPAVLPTIEICHHDQLRQLLS